MEDMLKAFEADLLDPAKRDEVKSRLKMVQLTINLMLKERTGHRNRRML